MSLRMIDGRITRSEADVLERMATGMTAQEIADDRHTSRRTVTSQQQDIYKRLQLTSRSPAMEAVALWAAGALEVKGGR